MVYVKQINGDEYVETGKLNMTKAEVKAEWQKEGLEAIKGVLDKQYTSEITINDNNIISECDKYKQKGDYSENITYNVKIEKMLMKRLEENILITLVYAKINDESFNVILKLDNQSNSYSIFLEDYLNKHNYNENMKKEDIKINSDSIKANGYNKYIKINTAETYVITQYFSELKTKMINKTQEAYELLDKDYREKKYGGYDNFKRYVENNKNTIAYANIKNYQENEYDDIKEYVCIDDNGEYYIFLEETAGNYRVVLDTYTINIPSFLEKYNEASEEIKVGYNIQKIFDAINDGDYKYVYNKLDDTFKSNNFKTQADFEKYVKQNFYENNSISHERCEKNGNTYMYDITIKNKADEKQTINKTIIMQLKEGTDFVMSFNVK